MKQEQTEDWIDYIIKNTVENYNGREVVIWGRYGVSNCIKDRLKEKYGIDISFFIDSDPAQIDEQQVFSPNCLSGKSDKYYVVIPIAFYQSVKEKLIQGGYSKRVDYCYFSDCISQQTQGYYEDAHGNKIIGKYEGLKFCFSGFHSVIVIGDNVQFRGTSLYIHNDSKIVIDDNSRFIESKIYIHHSSEVAFGKDTCLDKSDILVDDETKLEMKCGCDIVRLDMKIGKWAEVILNEEVIVRGQNTIWKIDKAAKFQIGNNSIFGGGICSIGEKAVFKIGKDLSINEKYRIVICANTSVFIGDDCMLSYDIVLRSNDGHTIFDILTKKNINCSDDISRDRKIIIGNHVWVGERAEILYNTQIGDGSVIGAMSLVKCKIPNNCVAAGIPARVIRKNVAWSRQYGADDILECGKKYINNTEEL